MTDGNDPSASAQLFDQVDSSLDLWRERHEMEGAVVFESGQGIKVGKILKRPEMFAMKSAALCGFSV